MDAVQKAKSGQIRVPRWVWLTYEVLWRDFRTTTRPTRPGRPRPLRAVHHLLRLNADLQPAAPHRDLPMSELQQFPSATFKTPRHPKAATAGKS